MKVICTRCGGTNIACEAIVNPNTGKIIDYLDESFMHANCGDCKEEAHKAKMAEKRAKICEQYDKEIRKAEVGKKVMLCVLDYGLNVDNVIYYNHNNTLRFNWVDYGEKITKEEFDNFVNNVDRSQLPEGIKFELK